jgi:2-dehydropantoate 2-reductase
MEGGVKVCVVGAGAVGGMIAARLSRTPAQPCVLETTESAAVLRERGLRLIEPSGDETRFESPRVSSDPRDLGPQDVVLLAVKAYAIPGLAKALRPLFHAETRVVTLQNGVPWWYFQRLEGPYSDWRIDCLDPSGEITANIEARRVLGGVVYTASELLEPGVVRWVEGNRISLGELEGARSEQLEAICQLLRDAGFKSYVLDDVRGEMWLKLWGNLSINPLSALTHASMSELLAFPLSRDLVARLMGEMQDVASAVGASLRMPLEQRLAGAEKVGGHKTSTLQDAESGRRLEVDALLGSVVEIAGRCDVRVPGIEAMYASLSLLDRTIQSGRGVRTEPSP